MSKSPHLKNIEPKQIHYFMNGTGAFLIAINKSKSFNFHNNVHYKVETPISVQ